MTTKTIDLYNWPWITSSHI